MQSLTGSLLIDFQSMPGTEEERQYHKQVYSIIKLHISQMEKFQQTPAFVYCSGQTKGPCGMVLTVEDKRYVYDWEEISSNPKEFKDIIDKHQAEKDRIVVWICSFCNTRNVIRANQVRFAKNNSRVIEKAQNNNIKPDPILLIVFDISGSMGEEINKNGQTISTFEQKIRKTKIYSKIVAQEEKEIKDILQKQKQGQQQDGGRQPSNSKYQDILKKNKLLMGMTEWLISDILTGAVGSGQKAVRAKKFNDPNSSKAKPKNAKTIGFMFFNSSIVLQTMKENKEKTVVVVCDSNDGFPPNSQGAIKEKVNFDDFSCLFKVGEKYGGDYTTKLTDFQFNDLDLRTGSASQGQTALGPAMVTALGVISRHGAGSSIVIVTDGIGNKGIFDQSQKWDEGFKLLKMRLEKYKCFLTILQCRNIDVKDTKSVNNIQTSIDTFCKRHQESIAQKINILIDQSKPIDALVSDIKTKMSKSINRDNVIWANGVTIKSQNPNVTFNEDMKKLTDRLFNLKQPTFIHPKVDLKGLKQKDYMHHFMTQTVIRYENTLTGEQSTFMTYIHQKFIKFDNLKKKTIKALDTTETFMNMMEYLISEEDSCSINNMPLSFVKKAFRDTLSGRSICSRSMRFTSREGGQREQWLEDAKREDEIIHEEEEEVGL